MLEFICCAFNNNNSNNKNILMLKLGFNLIWNLEVENDIEKKRKGKLYYKEKDINK